MIIRDPELAEFFGQRTEAALETQTYEVFLNADDRLRWRATEDGQEVLYDKEPETTWWQRFTAGFVRILPIRGQL